MFKTNIAKDLKKYDCIEREKDPENPLSDIDKLRKAALDALSHSSWKGQTMRYIFDLPSRLLNLLDELKNKTYKPSESHSFIINERGKPRVIHANSPKDRVVERLLSDHIIMPSIMDCLIYDNSASIKGRGVHYARKRLKTHLSKFYRTYNDNDGYILIMDFKSYYDNIRHDIAKDELIQHISEYDVEWLIKAILEKFEVDVSYMSDYEFEHAMDEPFTYLDYYFNVKEPLKSLGKKKLKKHLDIGDQISQNIAILYPHTLDNYIKNRLGIKFYGRYMDDFYIIARTKEELHRYAKLIKEKAFQDLGLFIKDNKTIIQPINKDFKYLQFKYKLSNTGKILVSINRKSLLRMKRKLKKLHKKFMNGVLTIYDIMRTYDSWIYAYKRCMSNVQYKSMQKLYYDLYGDYVVEASNRKKELKEIIKESLYNPFEDYFINNTNEKFEKIFEILGIQ